MTTDQRSFLRPYDEPSIPNQTNGDGTDIGAFEYLPPTSANVSVSGRVQTASGNGLLNAIVSITAPDGVSRTVKTGSFGYFHFDDVEIGQTYVLQVKSRRFAFAPQIITVNEDLSELIFTAQE